MLQHDVVVSTKTGKKIDQTFAISDVFKVLDAECPETTALMFKAGALTFVQWPKDEDHASVLEDGDPWKGIPVDTEGSQYVGGENV